MSTQIPKRGDSRRDEVIAGEYVLGALSVDDRRKVEARMMLDSNFAAMVNRWQTNLSSLDSLYDPIVSTRAYPTVERRSLEAPVQREPTGLWNSLGFWRFLTGLAVAGLAVIAVLEAATPNATPSSLPVLAELSGEESAMGLIARYDAAGNKLVLTPVAASQEMPRSLEVWMIEEGATPKSLGVLPQTGGGEIRLPPEFASDMKTGVTLAVSVEPAGGSTGEAAIGTIIASGKAVFPD